MRLLIGVLLVLTGCGTSSTRTDKPAAGTLAPPFAWPYQLTQPDDHYTLPKALKEVSGLTYYQANQLLCIQDEEAVVYVFDTQKKQVVQEFGFGGYGDFEGIEYVGGEVYALESNGNLSRFKIGTGDDKSVQVGRTQTDLPPHTEVEGLGYDPKTKRLLIAVKNTGKPSGGKPIYSFDLRYRLVFKDMQLNDEQLTGAGIDPKTYKPAGIAVHPITGEWYVLSSADKRLIVTSRRGRIIASQPLDGKLFRQPEGICFAPNGDLFIASEGRGKKGYILKFAYQK